MLRVSSLRRTLPKLAELPEEAWVTQRVLSDGLAERTLRIDGRICPAARRPVHPIGDGHL